MNYVIDSYIHGIQHTNETTKDTSKRLVSNDSLLQDLFRYTNNVFSSIRELKKYITNNY